MEINDGDHEMIVEDFNELFEEKSVAHESIILTEDDISDPHIHIDFEKLSNYKVEHLKRWLVFRGDTLQGITTLKEAQVRVMSYFENKTEAKIVDPTPDKIWLRKKAEKMGVILKPLWKEGMLPSVPLKLKADMSKPTDLTGWSKSLKGMPNFTVEHIQNYHEHVNETFCKNSTKIKKHFIRGEQFLEEKFLDTDTIYVKEDETIFCLKGVAAASLKKANRWVFLAIEKKTSNIEFANCQCPAGRCGTCSHAYAMMKLLAKWVVDGLSMVPATKACTSKPCVWNVPQSRGRIEKVPIMEMMIKSPPSKKTKKTDNVQDKKGIVSSLYEPRIVKNTLKDDINFLIRHMEHKTPTNICATKLLNPNPVHHRQTQFGTLPSGSYLSYQCSVMPPDFTVYCSIDRSDGKEYPLYQRYPQFPFQSLENVIDTFTKDIHIVEIKKNNILENLKSHSEDVNLIETSTRNQADDPNWFLYRKNRFTASLCNKLGKTGRKTEKSSKTLAHNIVTGSKKNVNRIMKMKMEYGRFYEPIAIQHYERYI
ncbi:uncharacterized protein LOC130613905 [Hydractinia symbiolongicarpus]|uniref:uncharacterized protein LOC130613905 n=1 Tax=Hydractinia symbiolongicarpus TaxID=13093 RepID=UPI00254F76D9|nr:uncharacterized protein LOC130613905 [Hydractinia symbiolongicarpus]